MVAQHNFGSNMNVTFKGIQRCFMIVWFLLLVVKVGCDTSSNHGVPTKCHPPKSHPPCARNEMMSAGCCEACPNCPPGEGMPPASGTVSPEDINLGTVCLCEKCPIGYYQTGHSYECKKCFDFCGNKREKVPNSCTAENNTKCTDCPLGFYVNTRFGGDPVQADCGNCKENPKHSGCNVTTFPPTTLLESTTSYAATTNAEVMATVYIVLHNESKAYNTTSSVKHIRKGEWYIPLITFGIVGVVFMVMAPIFLLYGMLPGCCRRLYDWISGIFNQTGQTQPSVKFIYICEQRDDTEKKDCTGKENGAVVPSNDLENGSLSPANSSTSLLSLVDETGSFISGRSHTKLKRLMSSGSTNSTFDYNEPTDSWIQNTQQSMQGELRNNSMPLTSSGSKGPNNSTSSNESPLSHYTEPIQEECGQDVHVNVVTPQSEDGKRPSDHIGIENTSVKRNYDE